MQAQRSKGDARVDNFIQITVLCPPKPRVRAFVYRNAEKVKVYWTCTLNPASGGGELGGVTLIGALKFYQKKEEFLQEACLVIAFSHVVSTFPNCLE